MRIKDKAKPKYPPIPPNLYAGICVAVIDLGEQYSEMFKKYDNKVQIVWELPNAPMIEVDGKQQPRQLSRTYTLAINKKSNLRKLLTGWNGVQYSDEAFAELDLFEQLGKPCFLNVVLNDTGEYNNIETVTPIAAGFPVPTTATPFIKWDMDEWNEAEFAKLPEWAQEKIKKSTQYQKAHPPTTTIDFAALSAAQAPQPVVQPVQQTAPPVQQTVPPLVQQAAPQVQQSAHSAPAAPGAANPQAYLYQGAAPAAVTAQTAQAQTTETGWPF